MVAALSHLLCAFALADLLLERSYLTDPRPHTSSCWTPALSALLARGGVRGKGKDIWGGGGEISGCLARVLDAWDAGNVTSPGQNFP